MKKLPEILEVTTLADTRIFHVEGVHLRFENGEERQFERLKPAGQQAVMIAAVNDKQEILLIKEYGTGVEHYTLGLPKGLIDVGELLEDAANRELKEEVGFGAKRLTLLKKMTLAPAYMSHVMYLYLAEDLYPESLPGDEPEPIEVVPYPLSEIETLMQRDDFSESRSMAAVYMVKALLDGR